MDKLHRLDGDVQGQFSAVFHDGAWTNCVGCFFRFNGDVVSLDFAIFAVEKNLNRFGKE
jgi:hypothetical protein